MIGNSAQKSRAFTLVEMMITLGLVAIVYAITSGILLQIARFSKEGRRVAQSRFELLTQVETLRYQLRTLVYPDDFVALSGRRSGLKGRDTITFLTTSGRKLKGLVEVGYKIEETVDPDSAQPTHSLFYREFPFRRSELRRLDEQQEGKWEAVLTGIDAFEFEYTSNRTSWQKEWTEESPPVAIRVSIRRVQPNSDKIAFEVTPGIASNRW